MKIDFETILWIAEQSEEVAIKVAPLVAQILNVETQKILDFVAFLREATEQVVRAIEMFVNFPSVFGAEGPGVTDSTGCSLPDCDCPNEFQDVVWALKAQAVSDQLA